MIPHVPHHCIRPEALIPRRGVRHAAVERSLERIFTSAPALDQHPTLEGPHLREDVSGRSFLALFPQSEPSSPRILRSRLHDNGSIAAVARRLPRSSRVCQDRAGRIPNCDGPQGYEFCHHLCILFAYSHWSARAHGTDHVNMVHAPLDISCIHYAIMISPNSVTQLQAPMLMQCIQYRQTE